VRRIPFLARERNRGL
jgi:hypothetical protein